MKNKKLFAILTLVCFMFTLMPVAAFAADKFVEVDKDSAYVTIPNLGGSVDATLNLIEADATTYAAYAYVNGAFSKDFGFQVLNVGPEDPTTKISEAKVTFNKPGTYELHVVNNVAASADGFYAISNGNLVVDAKATNGQVVTLLEDKSNVVMLKETVVVGSVAMDYAIDVVGGLTQGQNGTYVLTNADSAYTENDVIIKVGIDANKDGSVDSGVANLPITISTNSSAVSIIDADAKTNGAGLATFTVAGTIAGDFKIYVDFGYKVTEIIDVKVSALAPAQIVTVKEPSAPVALGSEIATAGVVFNVTDANGNTTNALIEKGNPNDNYRVVIDSKPTGSGLKGEALCIDTQTMKLAGDNAAVKFDKEGDYSFRVVLDNGAYATAKVTVKEFIKPVALKLTYKQTNVELNGVAELESVVYVDKNGVTKNAIGEVTLSANGYAVANFNENNGTGFGNVKVKANENYVGSKITVLAVSDRYDLTDVVELTVANEAAGIKYASTEVAVGVNNVLKANVVDVDGNKVALNGNVDTANIKYIVLDKPENAKVAISTKDFSTLATTGEFKVSFTASQAGEYKVQTLVRYEQAGGQNEPVVKYYSGIETITVGATGIKDVVVMSIGSDQIIINNTVKTMLCEAVIKDGRTMVPFRAGLEALGATVDYDQTTQSVIAEMNGTKVVMTLGEKAYTVNGVAKVADVAPYLNVEASTTMVPASFVAAAFGINVDYTTNPDGTVADVLFAN